MGCAYKITSIPAATYHGTVFYAFHPFVAYHGGRFVRRSGTIGAILVEDIMRKLLVKMFEFGQVVQEDIKVFHI